MITRLQHIGLAVENLEAFSDRWDKLLGLRPGELRRDQGKGFQFDDAYHASESMLAARGSKLEFRVQGEPLPS